MEGGVGGGRWREVEVVVVVGIRRRACADQQLQLLKLGWRPVHICFLIGHHIGEEREQNHVAVDDLGQRTWSGGWSEAG